MYQAECTISCCDGSRIGSVGQEDFDVTAGSVDLEIGKSVRRLVVASEIPSVYSSVSPSKDRKYDRTHVTMKARLVPTRTNDRHAALVTITVAVLETIITSMTLIPR